MELRDYQIALVDDCRREYRAGHRAVLLQLATGGGKTALTCHGVIAGAAARGNRILVLVHRAEILTQFCAALRLEGVAHGVIAPGYPRTDEPVQVGSIATVLRRLGAIAEPQIVVIDEAHHARASTWRTVIERFTRAKLLGLTATPQRLDGKGLGTHAGGLFDALIQGPPMQVLIDRGYLAKPRIFAAQRHVDLSSVRTIRGDFETAGAEGVMTRPEIVGDAVEQYLRRMSGMRAVAFCTTLDHATRQAAAFNAAGIRAERIDGALDAATRAAMIERLASGRTKVLLSVSLIEEGFDLPAIEGAILLRPTQSVTIYLQQIGRALRMAPGKTTAIIHDHVGNTLRHGLPTEARSWSLDGVTRRENNAPAAKRCEVCYAMNPPGSIRCLECGALFVTDQREGRAPPDQREGELIELTDEVRARLRRTRLEEERIACRGGEPALRQLAERRGYSMGWVARRLAAYQSALRRNRNRY